MLLSDIELRAEVDAGRLVFEPQLPPVAFQSASIARHGLIVHCTAPHVAPGWGYDRPKRITLELANLGAASLKLRAGIGIAQLLVFRLGSPSLIQYAGRHRTVGSS